MKIGKAKRLSLNQVGFRFDASYHLSEGVEVKNSISSSPYKLIRISDASSKIFIGGRAKRVYVKSKEHGIPFLSSSDILQADLENVKLASKKYTPNVEEMKLKKGWTLISRSGTIGNCAFANAEHAQKLASEDVIRLEPNNILRQGYIYAYLASKQGYSLLTQGTFGAVIQHIEPNFVGSLPIPVMPKSFQIEVDNLIQESARLREEATDCLNKSVILFENNVGISDFNLGYLSSSLPYRNIASKFTRFDAQYQIGKALLSKEKKYLPTIKINTISTKILVGNRCKREYVEKNGVPFLSSSDMMLANPLRGCKYIRKTSNNIENMLVSKGDILISRSGTVGNTIIVGDTLDGVAVSEHAMKLGVDSSKIAPEYIFAYFKTKQGHNSLRILPYGSVIITLGEDLLGNVDLPIIAKEDMDNVIALIKEYVAKNDKAIKMENDAIQMVEQEIEKWNK